MRTTLIRLTSLATGLSLLLPASLWAHGGHAGDHGWLAGAAQPLLSLDHFLAGLFVAVAAGLGVAHLAYFRRSPSAAADASVADG